MRRSVTIGAWLLMCGPALAAQDSGGSGEAGVEEMVVYGVRFEQEGVLAVDRDTVDRAMATTLNELFRDTPGVQALQGPGRQFFDFNIRGSEGAGSVVVSVDGVEKNNVETKHGVAFNPIFAATDFLQSATVIKGPVSNTFGTGSVGGRVQLRTVGPDDFLDDGDRFGGSLRLGAESNGDGQVITGIGAAELSDRVQVLGGVSDRSFESYEAGDGNEVLNSGSDNRTLLGKVAWQPAQGWDVQASHTRTDASYIGSNVFGRANFRQDADFDNDVLDTGTSLAVDYRPRGSLHAHADVFLSTTEHDETLQAVRRGSRGQPGDTDERETRSVGGKAYVSTLLRLGDVRHDVSFGVSGTDDDLEYNAGSRDNAGDRLTWGFFVQDRIALTDRLVLIPGLRHERYDVQADAGSDTDGGAWLPKLTANYELNDSVVLTASVAEGIRAPTLNNLVLGAVNQRSRGGSTTIRTQLPSDGIEAERSRVYEVGAQWGVRTGPRSRFTGSVGLFRNEFRDRIEDVVLERTEEGDTTRITSQLQNVGEAFTQGVELRLAYRVAGWFADANYAWIEGERDDTGTELNSVRPPRLTVNAGWQGLDDRLLLQAEVEHIGDKEEFGENEGVIGDSSDAATFGNLFAAWQLTDAIQFSVRVNNLTDEEFRRFDQIDPSIGRNYRAEFALQL